MNSTTPGIKIIATGDIMLGDTPLSFGFGVRSEYNNRYKELIKNDKITDILKSGDIVLGNLESSYDDNNKLSFEKNVISINGHALDFLRKTGFNVLNLANNHILEHGENNLKNLKRALEERGFFSIGTDKEYRILKVRKKRIAIFSYLDVPDYKNTDALSIWQDSKYTLVKRISGTVDLTIAYMHWGNEFVSVPSQRQVDIGRKLVEYGANIVMGSHPHVLQPVERYKNGLIAYSLGNFLFDSFLEKARNSVMLEINIINNRKRPEYIIHPIYERRDYSIQVSGPKESLMIKDSINAGIKPLPEKEYKKLVLHERSIYRKTALKHFIYNIPRYSDKIKVMKWCAKRFFFNILNRKKENENPDAVYGGLR